MKQISEVIFTRTQEIDLLRCRNLLQFALLNLVL